MMDKQRFPSGGRQGDPLPCQDMMSAQNVAYFQIEPHNNPEPQSPTTASNSIPDYEFVPRQPNQRAVDISMYEVPPAPQLRQQPTQPEGDYGLVGSVFTKPLKPVREHKQEVAVNPPTVASSPVYEVPPTAASPSVYEVPPTAASPSVYEVPPTAASPPVYEVPPTFKQREERHEGSPQKKPCPLDISANDLAKIGHGSASPLGPEAAALATQPGYMFMGRDSPVDSSSGQYEYEVVGPSQSGFEVKGTQSANSQYELLTMSWTQSGGTSQTSLAQSSPVYEIAPTPILAPLEPRPAAPSTISQAPSVYEIAPPPRPYVPARPPPYDVPSTRPPQNNVPPVRPPQNNIPPARLPQNNVPPARPPQNNVPLIEGMDDKEPPPLAPRPHNEYAKFQSTGEPTLRQQGVSSAYEQVRIEAPNGKINVDQAAPPTVPAQTYMGDYCTLDPKAIGSMNPPAITKREDISSSSSFGSASGSDVSEIPPIPPPSPSLAEAAVFAALDTSVKHVPPKTEDESRPKEGDLRRDRPPVPSPRRESLHDRPKWYAEEDGTKAPEHEVAWDPFSNPPNKEETPPVNHNSDENSKNTVFTSLHKRYSVHGSRENLTEESTEQNAKEGGSEDQKQTPLIYENVLFKRSDSAVRSSVTKKPEIQATEMETKPEDKDGSAETKHESYFSSDLSSSLDEEAEWEKIDQLLLSIGEIENIGEQIADAGKATTVPDWLKALGVAQYESDLMTNGFDTLDFLNGGVLEDLDLLEIGVTDVAHRKVILEAAKLLPSPPRVAKLDNPPSTVEEWLKLIKLSEYLEVFLHHGFASMDRVKMLWEVELTSVLEINCLGHRNRILTSLIEPRRMTMVRKSRQTELDSKGNFGLDEKLAELKLFCPDEEPAKVVAALDGDFLNKIADEMINDESLKRKTLEKKKAKQWRHEPEVLLKGSVNYTTQYLGSQTVKEIVGVKSTVDACRKMKLSTAKLQKIPSVTLAVSVNGIKFIDSRTKLVVSNHQMSNVSYITQDPENKRIFAYIAKDAKVNRHYCHVFRVEDLKLSDEITMTIGQAFELAYDQYMQIQTLINPKKS
ncbi:hypothetical protein QZH41_011871 [Actinostola sp. cb2023]|nr:hypothetical protein QZH41_011871 [Actinostola sp. cb2023]